MIEQKFNYADATVKDMTNVFKTIVENVEPKDEKENFLLFPRKSPRRGKGVDSHPSIVESSEDSFVDNKTVVGN